MLQTEAALFSGTITRVSDRIENNLDIELHNALDDITFATFSMELRAELLVEINLDATEMHEVTDNNYFRDALARVDRDLKDASGNLATRYEVGTEAIFGVSLSATAGVLVWVLRGGALLASMVAATPLWSSIDPVRVVGGIGDEDSDSEDEVEKVFD